LCCSLLVLASSQQHQQQQQQQRGEGLTSADFYTMVEDLVAGRDYYELLEVSPEQASQPRELKKAFRALTLRWHPDKNPSPDAAARFSRVVFAFDILSDPVKKSQYDAMRTRGIPWHEIYYGRYAHRYGVPQHDVRWVIFWLVFTVTVLHYAYRRHRYNLILSRVKQTATYKHRQAQLKVASGKGVDQKRRKQLQDRNSKSAMESEPEVKLMGIRPPGWRDLVVVRLVLLPWTVGKYTFFFLRWLFWYKLLRQTPPPPDLRELMRERLGLSPAEYDEWEREMKEKQARAMKYTQRRYK